MKIYLQVCENLCYFEKYLSIRFTEDSGQTESTKTRYMKKAALLGLCAMFATGAMASPLTPQQALERMGQGRMAKAQVDRIEKVPVLTVRTAEGNPAAYIFNNASGHG